ncbi:MAG: hypothetical protein KF881_04310 [Acidobacteria bacterium]|nr:hypothetical protein [Acidobacteriota bacterium]
MQVRCRQAARGPTFNHPLPQVVLTRCRLAGVRFGVQPPATAGGSDKNGPAGLPLRSLRPLRLKIMYVNTIAQDIQFYAEPFLTCGLWTQFRGIYHSPAQNSNLLSIQATLCHILSLVFSAF